MNPCRPSSIVESGRAPRNAGGRRLVALIVSLLIATGCAVNLPGPTPPPRKAEANAGQPPRVFNARGPLPPRRAHQVIQRLARETSSDLLQRHLHAMEGIVSTPLRVNNSARLLIDGPQTHDAMYRAIEAARDSVNLETYIIEYDEVGQRFAELLRRKRSEGVHVNLIYDSVGSIGTPNEYFDRLRSAGVKVCEYNPVNPLKAKRGWRLNNRDHRKILVVDGRVAFAGGINISHVYASSSWRRPKSESPVQEGWRDTHIEVRGPVVADLQKLFVEHWFGHCGDIQKADYFPRLSKAGNEVMRVVGGEPGDNEIYAELLSAIERAEKRIYLTVGYFVPDPRTVDALKRAAARGVDVRLALPGVSDFWAPLYAGRSHYRALLRAGVRIYERHDALLHAKTAVIDGVWSTVGSTNLDWRSFALNAEVNVIVLGVEFGDQMEALFQQDIDQSDEIELAKWRHRGLTERMKEWFARQWEYLL
ncbi:MAG TPA: phospholipase D-like domain-containing protein [Burkholderiales bacterium]|nr:phospholipase D-like domain-containing protein [Burkholderiales bacterium]